MSSASTTLTTTSASSSLSNNDDNQNTLRNSSSLLFGFLVTFLALFVAFMLFGLGWRHWSDRRRGRMGGLAGEGRHRSSRYRKPKLWDIWVVPSSHHWNGIQPLSASAAEARLDLSPMPSSDENRPPQLPSNLDSPSTLSRFLKLFKSSLASLRTMVSTSRRSRQRARGNISDPVQTSSGNIKSEEDEKCEREKRRILEMLEEVNNNGLEVAVIITMPNPGPGYRHRHPQNSENQISQNEGNVGISSGSSSNSQIQPNSAALSDPSITPYLNTYPIQSGTVSQNYSNGQIHEQQDPISTSPPNSSSAPPSHLNLREYAIGLTHIRMQKPVLS